jgi:hypothetical protein
MIEATRREKRKKRMIIALVSIFIALVLIWILVSVIENILIEKNKDENNKPIAYNFYYADFEENIFEDEEYTELIRGEGLRYCDMHSNVTVSIDENTIDNYGEDVKFFWDFLQNIVNGDKDAYNAMFSKEYFRSNPAKEAFTMQKIYDSQITKYSTEEIETTNGNYTKYIYIVEYRILKNNGTFRNDIGDGSRAQYITITNKSGEFLIDSIGYIRY